MTASVAKRTCVPMPLVALVNVIGTAPVMVPGASVFAVALTVKVTVNGDDVTVPDKTEAVSQLGTPEMAKLVVPTGDVS